MRARFFEYRYPHTNPREDDRTATAAYNFVPLPETLVPAVEDASDLPGHDGSGDREKYRHSGYFEVTLTTKSPLYIRCPLTREEFDRQDSEGRHIPYRDKVKNTPRFFHTKRPTGGQLEPVIPGSSLRGMLRAVLEIVSYGKIVNVANKQLIYRAVGDTTALGTWYRDQMLGPNQVTLPQMRFDYPSPKLQAGYLCRDQGRWAIRPARRWPDTAPEEDRESFIHVEETVARPVLTGGGPLYDVYVRPAIRSTPPRNNHQLHLVMAQTNGISPRGNGIPQPSGMVPGILSESGPMNNKHLHCVVYEEDPNAALISIAPELWAVYENDRDLTRGIPQPRGLSRSGDPVFYLLDDDDKLVFFGPNKMFRLPYQRSVHELIPEELRDPEVVDYAEAIFGYIRDKKVFEHLAPQDRPKQGDKRRAYAGRVSVTDAKWIKQSRNENPFHGTLSPKILSSPKPTTFQHYLMQHQTEDPKDLSHYDSPKEDSEGHQRGYRTLIRGHKRYWHRGNVTPADISENWTDNHGQEDLDSTQHTRMTPIRANSIFKFRIYFEFLSDEELGAICWTLHPHCDDPAKEYCHKLGMGKSLGMGAVALNADLYLNDRVSRYQSLFAGDDWATGYGPQGIALTDRSQLDAKVRPFVDHVIGLLNADQDCDRLDQLNRIGILLKMMEWEGQDANCVLDMGRHPNQNQRFQSFKERKVLPDPTSYDFGTFDYGNAVPRRNPGEVFAWTDDELADNLSDNRKRRDLERQFESQWLDFLRILTQHHGNTLTSWAQEQGGSPRRQAYNRFQRWCDA